MFSGGGEGDGLGRINMMPTAAMLGPTAEISPRGPPQQQPQWGQQETKEFIGIRAELEKDFTVTKRNKTLWEIVSAKMREKGYRRTPEQCKCKWKNLVNRYKVLFSCVFGCNKKWVLRKLCPFHLSSSLFFSWGGGGDYCLVNLGFARF